MWLAEKRNSLAACRLFLKDPDGNLIEMIDMKMNNTIIKSFIGYLAAVFLNSINTGHFISELIIPMERMKIL